MLVRGKEVYVIPFSHLDLFIGGTQEECLSRGNKIINEAIRIAERDGEFRFLLEIVVFVKNFIDSHPEKVGKLKRLIEDGKIEVGPRWAGIFQNPQSGEDLVRNILYAKKFLSQFLGADIGTVNLGDLPGYTPQYPQILLKAGIHNAVITRGGPKNIPLYFWQAPDGSRVLTWHAIKTYAWAWSRKLHMSEEKIQRKELEEEIEEIGKLTPAPILMHWGVDLVIPVETLSQNIKQWNQRSEIKLKLATPAQYFAEVRKKVSNIPVISGEVPSVWAPLDPALDILATNVLLSAEKFATIGYLLGFSKYPTEEFKQTWQRLLQAMDHNRISGQGVIEQNKRRLEYYKMATFVGGEILRNSLRTIAENIEIKEGSQCIPIVVFNPLSWTRDDVIEAHVTFHGDSSVFDIAKYRNVVLKDEEGKEIPFQYLSMSEGFVRDATISFNAESIPSIGYRTFYLIPSNRTPDYGKSCQIREEEETLFGPFSRREIVILENDCYMVRMNKLTGSVDIADKKINQYIAQGMKLVAVEERSSNLWAGEEFTGRVFENAVDEVKIAENGPISTKVIIRGKIRGLMISQEITLYKDVSRIDFLDIISWQTGQPLRIQHLFPLQIKNPQINYGIPYGVNSFKNIQPGSGPVKGTFEIPESLWKCSREIQKWIDVSNEKYGVTIASDNRSIEIKGSSTVKFNLIRGTQFPFCKVIKNNNSGYLWGPPEGEYNFKFSLNSHKGNWKKAKSYRKGWELVNPLISVSVNDQMTEKKFPSRMSFCNIPADNVVITVIKKGEEDNQPILRCYEAEGRAVETKVNFFNPLAGITETNLLEKKPKPLKDLIMQVKGHEIKTIRLNIAYPWQNEAEE